MATEKKKYGFHKPVLRTDLHVHLGLEVNNQGNITLEERLELDRFLGIERGVILPYPVNEGQDPTSFGVMDTQMAREAARRHPEHFLWFCNVEPDGTEKTRKALEEYKSQGARGVGEFGTKLPFDDPRVDHLLSCCGELGLPILFHMSPEGTGPYGVIDHPGLPLLEKELESHPDTIFIGHSQLFWYELGVYDKNIPAAAMNGFPFGKIEGEGRAVELMRRYPNLWADLSATSGSNAILRDTEYGIKFLREFQDRLMFGSDIVNLDMIFPIGQMLDYYLISGRLEEEAYVKICSGNAARLLGLDGKTDCGSQELI